MDVSPGRARTGLAAWTLFLAAVSFFPFRVGFDGPYRAPNGARFLADGALELGPRSSVATPGTPAWLAEAMEAESLVVRVNARSDRADQRGPARLVTLSRSSRQRNFMIGQQGVDLHVRARRPGADANGEPPVKVDGVFAEANGEVPPRALEVRITPERISVYVDGTRRMFEDLDSSPFPLWDPAHRLALGDEIGGARGWEGELRDLSFTVGNRTYSGLEAASFDLPDSTWQVPDRVRGFFQVDRSHAGLSGLAHMALFVPLGALLVLAFPGRLRAGTMGRAVRLGLIVALFSIALQLGKLAFETRHPSVAYAVPDATGALLGGLLVRRRAR